MRSSRRLGVILHRERRNIDALQAFHHIVVEIDMAHEHLAVPTVLKRGVHRLTDWRIHCEAMIVGGDLHLACGHILDRLVDATMTELEFVGAEPKGTPEQLVAEADAEERVAGVEHLAQQRDHLAGLFRVARPVREEHPVGVEFLNLIEGDGGRQHDHTAASLGHAVWGHGLDAQIDRGHGEQRLLAFEVASRLDHVGFRGAHLVVEAHALHLRGSLHLFEHVGNLAGLAVGTDKRRSREDSRTHHTCRAQVSHEFAGVDMRDAHDVVGHEIVIQRPCGAPVTHHHARVAHHIARDPDAGGFQIVIVDAGVADVRERLHHDLTIVARVGQCFLVAGHRGVEHDLRAGGSRGTEWLANVHLPVFKHENGILSRVFIRRIELSHHTPIRQKYLRKAAG